MLTWWTSVQRLRRAVVERAAGQLAARFPVQNIAIDLRAVLVERRANLNASIDELCDELTGFFDSWNYQLDEKLDIARNELGEFIRTIQLSSVPTMKELRSHVPRQQLLDRIGCLSKRVFLARRSPEGIEDETGMEDSYGRR